MDANRPVTLLEVTRRKIRPRHYSVRTERAYVYRIRQFVRYCGGRYPRDVGTDEIEAFLTYLAVERAISASTQNQAFSAICSSIDRFSSASCRVSRGCSGRREEPLDRIDDASR